LYGLKSGPVAQLG